MNATLEAPGTRGIDPDERAAWLQRRKRGLGSSDMPAVMGVSPYRTALDVYMSKIGDDEADEPNEQMEIGLAAESMLATLYERRTGRTIAMTQHEAECETDSRLIATLDGLTACGRIVEMKTAGTLKAADLGEPGSDELPKDWIVQAMHQLLVADAQVCDFAVLTGGFGFRFLVYTVHRDPLWDDAIREHGAAFWGHVERNEPPPAVLPDDLHHLKRLFAPRGLEKPIEDIYAPEVERWEGLGQTIKSLEDERKSIEGQLRLTMTDAAALILPDGRRLKRYQQDMPASIVERRAHVRDYLKIVKGPKS